MTREEWDARGGEDFARMLAAEYLAERLAQRFGHDSGLAVAQRENVEGWRENTMICWTQAARAAS